jgi:hypothetical protein
MPAARHIPERARSFGAGLFGGQSDVGQTGGVKGQELLTLVLGSQSKAQARHQISKSAARLHTGNGQRGGMERGEHNFSFRVSSTSVMRPLWRITSLDLFTRIGNIRKMNAFDVWNQDL